ncbi:membrane protein [Asanoa ishikariensis]|uniref:Uncharacterized membrane protein n=1 Tax=Asanoa ishikariensis TaxID=137265 RepID=A0A1H3QQ58_9ACTN|nr:membrane protein [Asanoa ishikariensis]SDZ15181.1 Uncharacterized membrane protein [Asanoa ishikariensis]
MGVAGTLTARLVEVVLAVGGLLFTIMGSESEPNVVLFLLFWSLLAAAYLFVGTLRVRRERLTDPNVPPPPVTGMNARLTGRRFSFFFTVAASITGLGASLDVLAVDENSDYSGLVQGLGAFVTICAWLLLQLGYARFYAQWTDWRFPECPYPRLIDFLYFSVTVGVSFAASDVEVRGRTVRYHVMVHSVISFLYNAIVLAIAVNIITG